MNNSGPCFNCKAADTPTHIIRHFWSDADTLHANPSGGGICDACWNRYGDSLSFADDLRQSVKSYVLRHGSATRLRAALADEWPLPMGAEALRWWALAWNHTDSDRFLTERAYGAAPTTLVVRFVPDSLRGLYEGAMKREEEQCERHLDGLADIWEGFPTDAYVGFVQERSLSHGHVRLFGTIESQGHDCWIFDEPNVKPTILQGGRRAVRKCERELLRLYRNVVRGRTFSRGGRPLGSVSAGPTDEERAEYAQACAELAPQDRGPTAVSVRMGAILNRSIRLSWVHYWMDGGVFPRDALAPRRTRRERSSPI